MTKATLATRAAAGLCAALISATSLVACGGEDSGADEPVEETTELADDSADRRNDERSATRADRRREPAEQDEEPGTDPSESREEPERLSAAEFCDVYTRYETKSIFAEADTPAGARRAADRLGRLASRLDRLASRTPRAIEEDIRLLAQLFGEIAEANGDEDQLTEIDASELPATQEHLERWRKKHC